MRGTLSIAGQSIRRIGSDAGENSIGTRAKVDKIEVVNDPVEADLDRILTKPAPPCDPRGHHGRRWPHCGINLIDKAKTRVRTLGVDTVVELLIALDPPRKSTPEGSGIQYEPPSEYVALLLDPNSIRPH